MKKFNLFIFILVQTVFLSSTLAYADEISVTGPEVVITEASEKMVEEVSTNQTESLKKEVKAEPSAESTKKTAAEQEKIKYKKAIVSFIKLKNPKLSDAAASKAAEAALAASEKHGIEVNIILAIMWKESYFTANAKGASCYGIMQVGKSTGAGFGYSTKDLIDPYRNADVATRLLKGQIKKFGSTTLGLTAYNTGGGNVSKGNYNTAYANNVLAKSKNIKNYIESYMSK